MDLRIDKQVADKLRTLSDRQHRSATKHVEYLIEQDYSANRPSLQTIVEAFRELSPEDQAQVLS